MGKWVWRKEHPRRLKAGGHTTIPGNWAFYPEGDDKKGAFKSGCLVCGAPTVTVRMPNARWVIFEGAEGLQHIKHPCLYPGEKIGDSRDPKTPDLFD